MDIIQLTSWRLHCISTELGITDLEKIHINQSIAVICHDMYKFGSNTIVKMNKEAIDRDESGLWPKENRKIKPRP